MGSVQRLATIVIFGLVALSTILFLYLGDENNRIDQKAQLHQESAIERATSNFIALCLQCHGPAGEGYTEPGVAGTGRVGAALGGINTSLNQTGVNASGTPWPGGLEARATIIHDTIYNGLRTADGEGYRMPAFGGESGSLTDSQINDLVVFIQHADWNAVYNQAVEASGGYPTPPPAAATKAPEATEESGTGGGTASLVIESHDIFFQPAALEIPANTDVTIELPNLGAAAHDFSIDALGISVALPAGSTESVVINAPPGEYEFYCNVPGHKEAGMHGILTVTEGYELPASGGETSAASGGGEEAGSSITIESHDIFFEPAAIEIPANTDVTVELPNLGAAAHDFSIDALGISIALPAGATESVVINAPPGEYEFYCNVPGHKEAGMHGILTVTEGYQLPASGAATGESAAAAGSDTEAASSGAATGASVTVESHDIFFEPATIEIPANTDVTFVLPNLGAAPHDFSIDELGITIPLAPGAEESVVINAPPGEYEFYCNVPGHKEAGMVGTLIVTEGYELPAAASGAEASAASGSADSSAASSGGETFTVVSHDIYFDPADLTIPADTDVTISLPNEGAAPHNFAIDELDISVDLAPGETESVVINAPAGVYEIYCNVPGHREAGMVGTLTVE